MALSTVEDLITMALKANGVLDVEGTATTAQKTLGLDVLNQIIESLVLDQLTDYIHTDEEISITDETTTWGAAGNVTTTRPLEVLAARKVVSGTETPLQVWRMDRYRAEIRDKDLAGEPQLVAYDPIYPLGILYAYPQGAYTLKVTSRKPWTAYTATSDSIAKPPGYTKFLLHSLAIELAQFHGAQPPQLSASIVNKTRADLGIINARRPVSRNAFETYGAGYNINTDE